MENYETYLFIFMFFIILFILIYIAYVNSLLSSNCDRIKEYSANGDGTSIFENGTIRPLFNVTLNKVFVKTAYNCCCTGRFKNDYVSLCALDNCNKQGVRALHFEIYNLNRTPIIATASVDRPKYKEMYNYLDFSETMSHVNNNFMNIEDPLFLILEINSDLLETYTSVYNSLNSIFSSKISNVVNKTLQKNNLSELRNKVCIMISFKKNNSTSYTSSKLNTISHNISNKIINYTTFLSSVTEFNSTDFTPEKIVYITGTDILVSNKQDYTKNYDFISSGIKYGITFTGMNFQYNDSYLTEYNQMFTSKIPTSTSSFSLKYGNSGNSYYSPIINAILPNNSSLIDSTTGTSYTTTSSLTVPIKDTNFYNKLGLLFIE